MNKKTMNKEQYFTMLPNANISRSRFYMPQRHKTTFNNGKIIPIYVNEVLPGDTFDITVHSLARLLTPLFPTMDKAWIETHAFFVPMRLLWEHTNEFWGENTTTKWEQEIEYEIPKINLDQPVATGSVLDYMGIPPQAQGMKINALPYRAYQLIYNEWYRNQNLIDPILINKTDAEVNLSQINNNPLNVCKIRDYFTSALPAPQKGPTVYIPSAGEIDIKTTPDQATLQWAASNDGVTNGILPTNLIGDLQNSLQASINALRIAFQTQKYYERDARHGSRYTELIYSHFGVTSPDMRLQRPEYLGGTKNPISITQIEQTQSSTAVNTPLGWTGATSQTIAHGNKHTYSATEHGYILILAHTRTEQTYSQGVERMWTRNRKLEFYFPEFANIGEQSIYNHEIYAQGNNEDFETFGFKEAWAEYRTTPNRISGWLRPQLPQSMDFMHYGIEFANKPILDDVFVKENTEIIDRTIVQQSEIQDQFIADFLIDVYATRPLPTYSIPGLIDHH